MATLSSHPATASTTKWSVHPPRRSILAAVIPATLIALVLVWGSYEVFPIYDDGWLQLLVRESGSGSVAQVIPDRPLYGWLLQWIVVAWTNWRITASILNGLLWIALAWATSRLWSALFPHLSGYSPACACAVMVPIVVTCQFTTIVTDLMIVPVVLGYLAAVDLIRYVRMNGGRLWTAAIYIPAAALISEYVIPVSAATLTILLGTAVTSHDSEVRRRVRRGIVLAACATIAGYLLFALVSDTSFRPSVSPTNASVTLARKPVTVLLNVINGSWRGLVGAYATAVGQVAIYWDSKSTILAILFGLISAGALLAACRAKANELFAEPKVRECLVLVAAMVVGLVPVALMGRSTALLGFGSRFLLPVLPVAAVTTVSLLFRVSTPWLGIAILGFAGGNALIMDLHSLRQEHQLILSIGAALKPMLSDGMTVAVVDRVGIDYEFSAKAASAWDVPSQRKFWLYDAALARKVLGPRNSCIQPPEIKVAQRAVVRSGPIDQMFWIETAGDRISLIEPYCRSQQQPNH